MNFRFANRIVIALGAVLVLSTARADATTISYTLTEDGCTGGCGAGPYGTITLDDADGPNVVNLLVTLNSPNKFVATGAGDAIEFNLDGNPTITSANISDITAGFAFDGPDLHSAFGAFMYTIRCTVPTGCGSGGSNPNPGPLTFDLTLTGIGLDSFIANADGYYFASDIIGSNRNSGLVAAIGGGASGQETSPVPEPASLMLLGSGLTLAARKFRKTKRA